MDYTLSSTGLQNVDANQITSDNATIFSSLFVSGVSIIDSINNLNSKVGNLNSFIGTSNSSLNITGTTQINFNAGGMNLTNINSTGLSVFHTGMTVFPFSYSGYYNVRERFDNLRHVFLDAADPVIKYDADNNTIIKINEQEVSSINPAQNYPKRIIFKDYLNNVPGYINSSGLNLLDVNGNYNNINNKFTQTGNSLLLCSNKTMVDSSGNLNVFNMSSVTILGTTYTGGTWLKVADTLNNNISGVSSLNNSVSNLLSQVTTISGNASNIASIANYYSGLQSSLAVTNGVVSSTGLILAFDLKENRFDTKFPLVKTAPSNGTSFNILELNYNNTLTTDSSNKLAINTAGFLTSPSSDLVLVSNASGQTTVALKTISQPMTCQSSLNVSGNFTCNLLNALNSTMNSILLTTSSTTLYVPNTTYPSVLMVSGTTSLFNNNITINGKTTIGQDIYNYSDSVVEMYKNFSIRKIPTTGNSNLYDRIDLKCGLGTRASYMSMEEGYDINLVNNIGGIYLTTYNTSNSVIGLQANSVNVSNNLNVTGKIVCQNLGQRIPMYFTTNRTFNLNGTNFSCYDIDLRLYTNSILLDGYNIRQFRIRTWLSDVDYQHPNLYQNHYSVFMSDRNGLSIFASGGPFENLYFDIVSPGINQFLYRNSFNILMYCSRQGSKKVYCIIEDLL